MGAKTGLLTIMAGNGQYGANGDGGLAIAAQLFSPQGVVFDNAGNLLIADTEHNCIRRVDVMTGIITTVAGNGDDSHSGDGARTTQAGIPLPTALAVDKEGNLLIVDRFDFGILRVVKGIAK